MASIQAPSTQTPPVSGLVAHESVSFVQIDPRQILSYGVIGLGFLLALLAFSLLQREKKSTGGPHKAILKSIYGFMLFSVALVGLGLVSEWLRYKTPATLPMPCSAVADWPKGQWYLWGRFDNHTPVPEITDNEKRIPQIFPYAYFTSKHSFISETEENAEKPGNNANERLYRSEAQDGNELMPRAVVVFRGQDTTKPDPYVMTETLRVSEDGCMMTGRFLDNRGNYGDEHYLYRAERYYVPVPDTDQKPKSKSGDESFYDSEMGKQKGKSTEN